MPKERDGRGRIRRKLADLGIYPTSEHYRPPKLARSEKYDAPCCAEDGTASEIDRFVVRFRDYRGKIVDFAIMQMRITADGDTEIARIDCCWGTIHWHLYDQDGTDLLDHKPICDIPNGDTGQAVVNEYFPHALKLMEDRWEANVRRWRGERY